MKHKAILGILLFLSGTLFLFFSFANHVENYINTNTERSLNNAKAIDDNIHEIIDTCTENLDFLANHRVFRTLQQTWLETGDIQPLEDYLKDHVISQNKYIADILVVKDDKIALSLKNEYEYPLIKIAGTENIYFCKCTADSSDLPKGPPPVDKLPENKPPDGNVKKPVTTYNLAILTEAENGVSYASVIDLERLYDTTANEKNQKPNGTIFTSKDGQFIIYKLHGMFEVGTTSEMQDRLDDTECEDVLLSAHDIQKKGLLRYKHINPADDTKRTGYLMILPVDASENKIFTIGVDVDFADTINMIQTATIQTLISGLIITAGISLLIYCVVQNINDNKKRKLELETLYEKNKELEAQAHHQRLEALGTLTSGIAHEFNNLLTPIMGYSMLTLEKLSDDNSEIYDNIVEIYNASRKAKDIISRLSELSRKKDTITFEEVCIDNVVNTVLNIVNSTKPEEVTAKKVLNCGNLTVTGNETLLLQMILNLVLNAFQVMEETGGEMTVETDVENENVVISVSDTGPGIPENKIDKVFEPFYTTKHPTKGTGLGLSIVQQVVETHHGSIKVKNRKEGGCTFRIYLPLILNKN